MQAAKKAEAATAFAPIGGGAVKREQVIDGGRGPAGRGGVAAMVTLLTQPSEGGAVREEDDGPPAKRPATEAAAAARSAASIAFGSEAMRHAALLRGVSHLRM